MRSQHSLCSCQARLRWCQRRDGKKRTDLYSVSHMSKMILQRRRTAAGWTKRRRLTVIIGQRLSKWSGRQASKLWLNVYIDF